MKKEYIATHGGYEPAYFVPDEALNHDIDALVDLVA